MLVQGVEMPTSDQLPEGLKALARRNAVEMTHARWNYDLERLTAEQACATAVNSVKSA